MKKQAARKLSLHRETLRVLRDSDLQSPAGGATARNCTLTAKCMTEEIASCGETVIVC